MKIEIILTISLLFGLFSCTEQKSEVPENIYISWGAHDQLSDSVKLTEELANKELDAYLALREQGVKLDYFLMDMFWFSKHTLYKSFNETWPNGYETFFKKAKENNVKLGLWLSANVLGWNENMRWLDYQDTLANGIGNEKLWMAFYDGVWPAYFNSVLEYWYSEGVTLFKIDFAAFYAVKVGDEGKYSKEQLEEMNKKVFHKLVADFRKKHPDCKFIAYNGLFDHHSSVKAETDWWLEVFDALFCGDPQPGLVPGYNFVQSVTLYSDQMFWTFAKKKVPISFIDNSQFMLSNTGTGNYRGKQDWKTMLVSTLAKRSMFQTYYGNLELLDSSDAVWMKQAQQLFYQMDTLLLIGDYPYQVLPFAYHLKNKRGGLVFAVNPSQQMQKVQLPLDYQGQPAGILFSQPGYRNIIEGNTVTLAPEQSVLIGFNEYANEKYSLGTSGEGSFPNESVNIEIKERKALNNGVSFQINKPEKGNIRLVFEIKNEDGTMVKANGGPPPYGKPMGEVLQIKVVSAGKKIPVSINYNKVIWSGLSWAVGEIAEKDLKDAGPVIDVAFNVADDKFNGIIVESCFNTIYE